VWGALIRQLVLFLFTKRGKRIAVLVGLALLCFVTALLIDSQMYLTAGVTAVLTASLFFSLSVRHFRRRAMRRVQQTQRQADEKLRRAAAAHGRSTRMDKAKSAVAGLARAAGGSVVNLAEHARTRIAGARGHFGSWRRKRT